MLNNTILLVTTTSQPRYRDIGVESIGRDQEGGHPRRFLPPWGHQTYDTSGYIICKTIPEIILVQFQALGNVNVYIHTIFSKYAYQKEYYFYCSHVGVG